MGVEQAANNLQDNTLADQNPHISSEDQNFADAEPETHANDTSNAPEHEEPGLNNSQAHVGSEQEMEGDGIFITEKPGQHDPVEDDEPDQPDANQNINSSQNDNSEQQMVPYSQNNDEMEVIYSEEEIASFKNIFDMFDKEKTGLIDIADFQSIMDSLNRNSDEVIELLNEYEFGKDTGKLSFEQFIILMQALEKRIIVNEEDDQLQNEGEGGQIAEIEDHESPRSATEEERAQYGSLLPRTGVHFLPDTKVIDFLKLLDDYRKKCEKEGQFSEAKRARKKFEDLKEKEILRQQNNMRSAQEQELLTVENAQKAQFIEFSQAWDNYMSDYEATAYLSLEKLKEKHLMEIEQLRERIRKDYKVKLKLSKELLEMRKRVRLYVGMKQYDDAEMLEQKANALEAIEREKMEEELEDIILKQEEKLRRKQQLALSALLKRIQRDRNEQLKHRQMDSQRLIQRNKNLLLDLLKKQNMEIRRTTQFLNFALGTRSPANPHYPKSTLYTDPKDAKLSFPKNKTPYYDPVSKTIKVPGKDGSETKSKTRRKSTAAGSKKAKKGANKAIKDQEEVPVESQDSIIKPQLVKD